MGRAPCCDKANVKRGPWSPEEDNILKNYVQKHGNGGNWIALPRKAGLKRCGKSCRLRWLNYLRPGIRHGDYTEEEDYIICTLYSKLGSRWSVIASKLHGRTDNDIKNYWNTKLKNKLFSGDIGPSSEPNAVLQTSVSPVETSYCGNLANYVDLKPCTWAFPPDMSYQQNFDLQKVPLHPSYEHAYHNRIEVSDAGTTERANTYSTISQYQDQGSTMSSSSSTNLGNNCSFRTGYVGAKEDQHVPMNYCLETSDEAFLSNLCFEE